MSACYDSNLGRTGWVVMVISSRRNWGQRRTLTTLTMKYVTLAPTGTWGSCQWHQDKRKGASCFYIFDNTICIIGLFVHAFVKSKDMSQGPT